MPPGGGGPQPVLMRPTPQLSVKTWGWGSWGGGGRLKGRVGGGLAVWPGGGSQGGGGLRATHYYHMHPSRGDVCPGVWGYGGMYVIIAC